MYPITIPKNLAKKDDLVVITRKEYEEMRARMLPVLQLKGGKAERLDKRVENALRDYRRGKTKRIVSLADLE
jgi:hypothetical protein